ncbi:MAG: glutaredoxin-related protein [Paracoccaceae bacterium]|jgi:glutaredoxin-related protein
MTRSIFSLEKIHPAVKDKVANFHQNIVAEVQDAVAGNRIVVVGMRYNDSVWRARRALTKAGLDFKYMEYGSYTSGWHHRLTLKMWTGWPTFPMVFVEQTFVGGGSDLAALLKVGSVS